MSDFVRAVEQLVELTTKGGSDADQGNAAQGALDAFDAADTSSVKKALRLFESSLPKATGRGAKVLHLVLGALVEAGAPPELAWPPLARGLREILESASRFASRLGNDADRPARSASGASSAAKHAAKWPNEAAAWELLKPRCLAAVACLSRSAKLRKEALKMGLVEAGRGLDERVEEVMFLSHVVRVLDDAAFLVIDPSSRRGFELSVRHASTNLELYVLMLDAIIGDAKKGLLDGKRPSARAVRALSDPAFTAKTPPKLGVEFTLVAYTALLADGSLPDSTAESARHRVPLEGVPSEIPTFEGRRVLLTQRATKRDRREVEVEPSFSALTPEVRLVKKLSGSEVDALLAKMATAAARVGKKATTSSKSGKSKERTR